ncbi:hypothetical protein [Thermomonas sp.]|uniref:hypothetical protein n=1 Tax=Thermomonas sp. TaxID=1971895 RepID=UPI0035AE5562
MDSMLVVGMAFAVLALLVLMIRRYPLGGHGGGDGGGWSGGGCDSDGGGDGGCDGGGGD